MRLATLSAIPLLLAALTTVAGAEGRGGGPLAFSWNAFNGPYFTAFDVSTPETLPVVAPFPADGHFVGAGEWVGGSVYMLDDAGTLWAVDPATGAVLGTTGSTPLPGSQVWTGLAVDPTTGIVYACTTDIGTSWLYTLDLPTGTATLIGQVTNAPALMAIAIDGAGALWGLDIVVDAFLAIDKATAEGTVVGPLGYDANFDQGMAWLAATDTIYVAAFDNTAFQGELRVADPGTGNTVLVGLLGSAVPGGINQLPWLGFDNDPAGLPFLDGFETGDTARWTTTVP